MSKKLNIIEAMKMPIGTEFKVTFEDRFEFSVEETLYLKLLGCKHFYSKKNNKPVDNLNDRYITATFIPIQQPVSFMEAIEGGLKGNKIKVDATELNKKFDEGINCVLNSYWNNVYFSIAEIFKMLSMDNKHLNKIIKEGKWYIEESEADSDE